MALNATVAYSVYMMPVDYKHQTTVITGASSGIGAAFARELARRGSDVVLVARRRDRLDALAVELREAHRITATVIPLDLSAPAAGRALATQVAERGLSVTSLINNAGFATDGPFHDEDAARLTEEINVDVANLVDITRAFIGPLRVAGTGVLVNVASMAAYQPIPGMAVYAASKAFVLSFTEALWHESRGTGLRVLSFAPGLTRTEFFDVLGSAGYKGRYQTPEQVVTAALHSLDRGNRQPSVTSGRMNSLSTTAARLLSRRRTVLVAASFAASSAGTAADRSTPRQDSPDRGAWARER